MSDNRRTRTRKGAPGIVEVAARAGVSPATVSRFFNNPGIVRPKTRVKIEKAAEDLGFIRDRMAGALHNRFSGTIGLIVPTIDNAIFAELIQAFAARLRHHDRTMLVAAHNYDLKIEIGIVRSLLERRIDGVAVIGFDHELASMEMLATRNVPVLSVWNYREDSRLPCVGTDNRDAGRQVVSHLLEKGHRDIALLFPPVASNDRAKDRYESALEALRENHVPASSIRLLESIYDIGAAKQIIVSMLQERPPTAIICGNDILAQGALYACQKCGFDVPGQISIIGIGDFRGSAHMEPALTTVRLPARQIGEAAADMLCSGKPLVVGNKTQRVHIPSVFVERESVGAPDSQRAPS